MTSGTPRPASTLPTVERLRYRLSYDAEAGILTWKRDPSSARGNRRAGLQAGNVSGYGYIEIGIDSGVYLAHRVIWALMTGAWPAQQIDHIDGTRSNNRWSNLRLVSNGENQQNLKQAKRHNRSGVLGVRVHQQVGGERFSSSISRDGKRAYLGTFPSKEAAAAAYQAAKAELHTFQGSRNERT